MEIGVTVFATDRTIRPHELAVAAEERGFASVYVPEHTHIPLSRDTPPPTGDDVLADSYRRTLDPYVALAAAAPLTSRIRLGTGVSLVAEHDPIVLAKQVATLDLLSAGRVVLGVGAGWNREEMADHGVDPARRWQVLAEHMQLAQRLWADEIAAYDGTHATLAPSWSWPKPVQRPRVRTLVGGPPTARTFDAVAAWADGWLPIGGAGLAAALPDLRARVADAGRDPDALHVVPFGVLPSADKLAHYASAGVTEVVLRVPAGTRDEVLPVLDDYTRLLD